MFIRDVLLIECQPYQDVQRRAYIATVNGDVMNQLDQATRGGTVLTQNAISQVASHVLQPSAESEGVAQIQNGWLEPRFRFIIRTEETQAVSGEQIEAWYIGYTDRSRDGYITGAGNVIRVDPNLHFHVTAVHRLNNQLFQQNGQQFNRTTKVDGKQFLYGNSSLANLSMGTPVGDYKIRPVDIFRSKETLNTMLKENWISPGMDGISHHQLGSAGSFIDGAALSGRRNNAPGTYLFDTLNNYQTAVAQAESYLGDSTAIVTEATVLADDGTAFQDPFFNYLRQVEQNITHRGSFTFKDLLTLTPDIENRTIVQRPQSNAQVWHAGNTEHWRGADNETISATLLVNAVPTILMDNLGANIRFTITNNTQLGQPEWEVHQFDGITPNVDWGMLVNRIMSRIMTELIPKVSIQNMVLFTLVVDSDISGDTMINISFDNQPQRIFVMPTFADNLASPVITNSRDRYIQVTDSIYNVASNLIGTQTVSPSIITSPTHY